MRMAFLQMMHIMKAMSSRSPPSVEAKSKCRKRREMGYPLTGTRLGKLRIIDQHTTVFYDSPESGFIPRTGLIL